MKAFVVAILIAMILVLAWSSHSEGATSPANSAYMLKLQCDGGDSMTCMQYLLGVVDGANIERRFFCPPANMVVASLPIVFSRYLRQHPELIGENRTTVAYMALRDALPCSK